MLLLLLPGGGAPVVRVEFETDGFIPAADVGNLLTELDGAFQRYVKARFRRSDLRLAVQRIEVSSLIADLVVVGADAVKTAVLHPEMVTGFISTLANLVTIAQGLGKGRPNAKDRKLVKAIQAPIAKGDAVQINIFVIGDANSVTVDKDVIRGIHEAEEEAAKPRMLPPPEVDLAQGQLPAPPSLLTLKGKFGTALLVKGKWYVRLEGEESVLNPVSNGNEVRLQDDRSYSFDGKWEGRSYLIRDARPL